MNRPRVRVLNTTPCAKLAGRWLAARLESGPDREKTLQFGFDIVFSWLTGMTLTAIVSVLLGSLAEGMAATLAAFVLRIFSAGSHCKTSGRCALVTAAVYGAIGKTAAVSSWAMSGGVLASVYAVSAGLLFLRAKPRDVRDVRNLRFRPASVLVLLTYALLSLRPLRNPLAVPVVRAVALACLWQCFTVTEPGARLMGVIDKLLDVAGVE